MEDADGDAVGLSTAEALSLLAEDVDDVIRKHCCHRRSWWRSLRLSLRESVTWNYRSLLLAGVLLLLLLPAITIEKRLMDIIMFIVILFFSVFNTFLVVKIRWKRWFLYKDKVEEIRGIIEGLAEETDVWSGEHAYPSLYQPTTPSVHLQWTYRDSSLINLPAALLVRGDVVLLRPGQEIFAECESVEEGVEERYSPGQVFRPEVEATAPAGSVSVPTQHNVQLPRTFGVTKTPFVDSLELMLVRAAEERAPPWQSIPLLNLSQALNFVHVMCVILLVLGAVESAALWLSEPAARGKMAEVFLRPVFAAFCLFPLLFPGLWLLLRSWMGAQFRLASYSSCVGPMGSRSSVAEEGELEGEADRAALLTPGPALAQVSLGRQLKEMWRVLTAWDTSASELVFTLGTLTALCCVDKKGVLSLPQPTVDKVFFLRRRHHRHSSMLAPCPTSGSLRRARRRSEASMGSATRNDNYSTIGSQGSTRGNWRVRAVLGGAEPQPSLTQCGDFHAHVLEVGNLPSRPYEQRFEDRHWQRYLKSLKPIGLNILLNNCNAAMFPRYTAFADYLTLLADRSPVGREVAAINHRCMCGLARQIGFVQSATQPFQLATSLAAFRHSERPGLGEDKGDEGGAFHTSLLERLFRALSSSHHRTPMAHVLSAVTSQARVGCLQLMSQGSADLLLDLCVDYWDGYDLTPLGEAEKRRALDFYHRHIHSAYCTAFAYSPLFESIAGPMEDVVLELPVQSVPRNNADPRAMIPSRRHLHGVQTMGEIQTPVDEAERGKEEAKAARQENKTKNRSSLGADSGMSPTAVSGLNRSMSAESMMSRLSAESISTSEDCMELLKNQVFLGMASLQYQPLADVVPLVNELQEACVRFVHFSQDNELRSRVFAEKLGLEAGSFNCHISLAERERLSQGVAGNSGNETPAAAANAHRSSQAIPEGGISRWDSAPVVMGNAAFNYRLTGACPEVGSDSDERLEMSFEPSASPGSRRREDGRRRSTATSSTTSVTPPTDNDSITLHLRQDKSQMPRGIAAIRPHLRDVDNIPLQVSLFTDCSPDAVREMVEIMQENGEMVCAVGSTLSLANTPIFLQADCSLGLQPDSPFVCVGWTGHGRRQEAVESSPMALASRLLSLSCSLAGQREMGLRFLLPSMADCRALVHRLHLGLAFYLTCGGLLSLLQLLSPVLGWPWGPGGEKAADFFPFDASCLLWLQLVSGPALLLPVLCGPADSAATMKRPPTKRDPQLVWKRLRRTLVYSVARGLPALVAGLVVTHCGLLSACGREDVLCQLGIDNSTNMTTLTLGMDNSTNMTTLTLGMDNSTNMTILTRGQMQRCAGQMLFLLMLPMLAVISLSYMKEGKRLLNIDRRRLSIWAAFSAGHTLLVVGVIVPTNRETFVFIHPAVWAVGAACIPLLLLLNEFIDYKESSINLREERRLRFMFNTKLGMYSPV